MAEEKVTVLRPYPFEEGQKITIEGGPRAGDWKVIGVTDETVTLRCPLSGREFEWKRFCYATAEENRQWPQED